MLIKLKVLKTPNPDFPRNMPFPFLRLPCEIRLQVYRLALIQPQPIELWPTNEVAFTEGFDIIPEDNATPKYSADLVKASFVDLRKSCAVAILRICKMVNQEATPVFYAKNEFRFSMDLGWMPMLHFLFTIGAKNRGMLQKLAVFAPVLDIGVRDRLISPAPPLSVFQLTRFNVPTKHLTLDYGEIVTKCIALLLEARSLQVLYLVLPPGLILEKPALETGLCPETQSIVAPSAAGATFAADIILVLAHENYLENQEAAFFAEANLLWETRVKFANDWRYAQTVMADEDQDLVDWET